MQGFNFTERVRRELAAAREEAARLHHEYVGTEHMLLAIVRDDEAPASVLLRALGVDSTRVVAMIEETVTRGTDASSVGPDRPYTARAKKSLELAMRAARELHHDFVASEHLLLGLVDEQRGIAGQVLVECGVRRDRLVEAVRSAIGNEAPPEPAVPPTPRDPTPQDVAREEHAWRRLTHALDVSQRLGAMPRLELDDDGTIVVSLGAELTVRVAFPPHVGVARRSTDG